MKEWYNDIDSATLQRIKTYSAFNDAQSKNLMVQTMYEYREKEIQDFKETNHELALESIARQKRIAELEKENAELKETVIKMNNVITETFSNLTKAKEIIKIMKHLLFDVWGYIDFPFEERVNKFLNEGVGMSNKVYNDNLDYSHHIEEQLTKAKEIIKDLLNLPFASNEEVFADVGSHLYKAEQFLKEVENV